MVRHRFAALTNNDTKRLQLQRSCPIRIYRFLIPLTQGSPPGLPFVIEWLLQHPRSKPLYLLNGLL